MNKLINYLKNLFTTTVEPLAEKVAGPVIESKIVEGLQSLHDTDPDGYKAAIYGVRVFTSKLTPIVQKTPTKLDDALLSWIEEAVTESAAANNVSLT